VRARQKVLARLPIYLLCLMVFVTGRYAGRETLLSHHHFDAALFDDA
jgi:hypothetical protein